MLKYTILPGVDMATKEGGEGEDEEGRLERMMVIEVSILPH